MQKNIPLQITWQPDKKAKIPVYRQIVQYV